MTNARKHYPIGRALRIFLSLAVMSSLSAFASAASFISGAVRNQTKGQAAAGDDVILLRLDQGMQEEAHTKTDASGAFTIHVLVPDKPHLVRIVHQGVNYDQQASSGDSLTIDVFDVATKVPGITGNIEILRTGNTESNVNLLHVSDMIEIKNESAPPLTQAGARTFEVYLPAQAKIASAMAAGSGKLAVIIPVSPVAGEPGHYTVNFPLRPGSTKFAFNYDIPYDGHAAFRPRFAYPMQQFAVMIPPTMKFTSRSTAFQILATGDSSYQVQAINQLKSGNGPAFEITGAGAMPSLQARAQPQTGGRATLQQPSIQGPPSAASLNAANSSATESHVRSDPPGTPASTAAKSGLELRILGVGAVLVLATCGFAIWRARHPASKTDSKANVDATQAASNASTTLLLDALKEELLTLETNRIKGSISSEEYAAAKQALEGTVKRALLRAAAKG